MSSYKADTTRLDTCWGKFNSAFNKVANGRAKDNKEIIKTYHKYVLALEILEESNTRHQAMMTAGFALAASAFLKLLIDWQKAINKMCKSLETELAKLEALVKRAKLQVAGASAQAALNLTLTGVYYVHGPSWLGRTYWLGGSRPGSASGDRCRTRLEQRQCSRYGQHSCERGGVAGPQARRRRQKNCWVVWEPS